MFKGETNLLSTTDFDVMNFVEDYDIYNSELLLTLNKEKNYSLLQTNSCENRLDLINMKLIYANENYYGLLGITNCIMNENDLYLGCILKKIPTSTISNIVSELYR